ncbi:MAG TPA: SDR family oxidoreductase [Bryobacteraceae bacterium]|nr:SDR family oxidoreductase [Bryobacteraceae bacterium]
MTLDGKICLVTGGSRGIGAATAIAMAAAGADVAIVARRDDDAVASVRRQIEKAGRRSAFVKTDLQKREAARRAVEETRGALGNPDVLVHAAGGPAPGSVLEVSEEAWHAAFDLHVHAAFYLCRAVIPAMQARDGGAIIFISSAAGLRGCPNSAAYSVVKGALPQFARSLARDFAGSNIRVNCVAPGVIRTRFQDYLTDAQVRHNIDNRIPLHREGSAAEVADLIISLVRNDFVTGETVTIDGGMTMRIV